MKEQRMYGRWSSPVTAKMLAGALRLGEPCWDSDGRTLAWLEGRSDRGVVVVQDGDGGATRDLTPGDMSVRAQVGYGGGDFTLHDGVCYFVAQADQRIYRQELAGGRPRPITPAFGACASPTVSPDGRWLVYVSSYEDIDTLAVVDTAGERWPAKLAEGRDFYMQPAWDPSGKRLAWVEWRHPNMPWDGAEVRLAEIAAGEGMPVVASSRIVGGGNDEAVFQPAFSPDGLSLYFVSDRTGMGQLYRLEVATWRTEQVTHAEGDIGTPAWNQGMRRFGFAGESVVAVEGVRGFDRLRTITGTGETTRTLESYAAIGAMSVAPDGSRAAIVASGGAQPPRVVVVDLDSGTTRVCRRSDGELVPVGALSRPEPVSWTSFDGEEAHGLYYPPASDRFEASGPAPLVVLVHGGPTSQVKAGWDAQAQFFATRGYGVLFPNHRGSTGYGREYMLKLRKSWGIYDVLDSKAGAEQLVREGRADGTRIIIMGGSAGGYTVLQSLCDVPGFYKAAVCMYGISNQFTLLIDTHKFEIRYSDSLLGPLPEAAAVYRERSPIFHAERIVDPVAIFQGTIDRVVPREQSDQIVASLRARGVTHEYHLYEGEGHGFRKSETIEQFWGAVEAFLTQHVLFA